MSVQRKISFVLVVLFALLMPAKAASQAVEGEVLVKFRGGARGAAALQAEQVLGHEVRRRFDRSGWQHVRLRRGQTLAQIRQRPDVIAAEPNYVCHFYNTEGGVPNDPRFQEQWALARIGATNAWAVTSGSSNVVVAVLDSGI